MTLIELAQIVRTARRAQIRYFRSRANGDLIESRRAEAEVDRAVALILDPPSLFPPEEFPCC